VYIGWVPTGLAGVAPQQRPVGDVVVGHDAFDGDAALSEPVAGSALDHDCGGGCLVVDLGVRDAGVVVDDGDQLVRAVRQRAFTKSDADELRFYIPFLLGTDIRVLSHQLHNY
jgi:hypothetical protein